MLTHNRKTGNKAKETITVHSEGIATLPTLYTRRRTRCEGKREDRTPPWEPCHFSTIFYISTTRKIVDGDL